MLLDSKCFIIPAIPERIDKETGKPIPGTNAFFEQKQCRLTDHLNDMFNRTLTMFSYKGLPKELHERDLELYIQYLGHSLLTYKDGKVYLLKGSFAPPINPIYENTGYIVNNPWANGVDGTYKIINVMAAEKDLDDYTEGKEGVLVRNDPLCTGLLPIFTKYGIELVENDLTRFLAEVNLRQIIQMIATDDNSYESAVEVLNDMQAGRPGVIMDKAFGDEGFRGNPISIPANYFTQLIEHHQFIQANEANKIGLNANFNMKRERLSEGETDLNEDVLRPLPDVMIEERKNDYKEFEDFTGGEIKIEVEFDSVWARYNLPYSEQISIENGEAAETLENDEISEENEEMVEDTTIEEETQEEAKTDEIEASEEEATEEPEATIEDVKEIVEDIKDIVEAVTGEETEEPEEEKEESEDEEDEQE